MRALAAGLTLSILGGLTAGCGPLDVGSDLLWTSRFESGDFSEWTGATGGNAQAFPTPPNTIAVSARQTHGGTRAAALSITAGSDAAQENAVLSRAGDLPAEAYYSAWYYLPRTVSVGTFWVIFKFRARTSADDPSTTSELYDMDLATLPSGEMTLELYDHRSMGNVPLDIAGPIVPVESWFQLEAFYRPANDATGHLTFWLDGRQVIDLSGILPGATPWVEWDVCSVGEDLTPQMVTIYVDDCAVSRSRVGPAGQLAR